MAQRLLRSAQDCGLGFKRACCMSMTKFKVHSRLVKLQDPPEMDSGTIKKLIKDYRMVLLLVCAVLSSLTEQTSASQNTKSKMLELSEDTMKRYCSYNPLDAICRHVRTTKRNGNLDPFVENFLNPKAKKINCRTHIMHPECRGAFITKKKSIDFGEDYDFKLTPMEDDSGSVKLNLEDQNFNNPLLGKLFKVSVMDGTSGEYDPGTGNYIK